MRKFKNNHLKKSDGSNVDQLLEHVENESSRKRPEEN